MGGYHVNNVFLTASTSQHLSRLELINWVNAQLVGEFKAINELCTGAAYVQFLDWLFPGSVPMAKVKFCTIIEYDFLQNFKLLQTAFQKIGIQKTIPIQKLVKGHLQENLEFLQYFKIFFDANYTGQEYDPVAARSNIPLAFRTYSAGSRSSINLYTTPRPSKSTVSGRPRALQRSISSATARTVPSSLSTISKQDLRTVQSQNNQLGKRTNEAASEPVSRSLALNESFSTTAAQSVEKTNNSDDDWAYFEGDNFFETYSDIKLMPVASRLKVYNALRERDFYFQKLLQLENAIESSGLPDDHPFLKRLSTILFSTSEGFEMQGPDE